MSVWLVDRGHDWRDATDQWFHRVGRCQGICAVGIGLGVATGCRAVAAFFPSRCDGSGRVETD